MPEKFTSANDEAARARETAALADVSYRRKFDGSTRISPCSWALSPRHFLTIGEPPLTAPKAAVDVTGALTNLLLIGPQSRRVLAMLTSLDVRETALPDFACSETKIAHVHAALLREDVKDLPGYHIVIPREYSESVWTSILHAGREFELCPAGLAALELLRA
jgi:heterotetrameric sarcosine oxidase gamma subunit